MSADTPAAVDDSRAQGDRVRDDHAQSAKPDRAPRAEHPSSRLAEDGPPKQPAQTLNRADYNRARHDQPPIQRPGDGKPRAQGDAMARAVGGNGDRLTDHVTSGRSPEATVGGHPRPDGLNRADYNRARHEAPPIQRSGDNGHQEPAGTREQDDHGEAPPALRHQEGEGRRQEAPPAEPAEAGDGKAEEQAKPAEPGKVYVDGHEIEVTGDPADGLWIQGLPGEVPGKAGDVFAGPEKGATEKTRSDKAFGQVIEVSDDLFDSVEKNANTASQLIERPPTHAEVPVSVHPYTSETHHHAPEAGSLATATLALGIMLWAGGRRISEQLRGAHDARDR